MLPTGSAEAQSFGWPLTLVLFLCHSLTCVAGSSGHLKAQSCEFVRQLSGLPPMDCRRDEMQKVASPAVLFRSQPYTSQSCLSINCHVAIVFLHGGGPFGLARLRVFRSIFRTCYNSSSLDQARVDEGCRDVALWEGWSGTLDLWSWFMASGSEG